MIKSLKNKRRKLFFLHDNYKGIPLNKNERLFVYMDPPYSLTTGVYNDGKRGFLGWNKNLEKELFDYSDKLSNDGIPFMLSYVLDHKGKRNEELLSWIQKKNTE